MLDWVAGVIASTNAATDITKSLINFQTDAAVNAKAIELTGVLLQLQQQLMNAQMEQMGLVSKVHELEAELKKVREKSDIFAQYKAISLGNGQAYVLKSEHQTDTEVFHCCPQCFQDERISYMNFQRPLGGHWLRYICNRCNYALGVSLEK